MTVKPRDWWNVLAWIVFIGALVVPLALTPLPFTADGRNHILRTLLVERALAAGEWFPRYFPELAYGFGAPLLNYYAPLTYYLTAALSATGIGLSYAFQLTLAISLVAGALGAATWAGAQYGEKARLPAAVLWAAAPYTLFNVYARGAGPEALGLAWLPWLAWALTEAVQHGTLRARLTICIGAAGLMLTHNLTALLGFALLAVLAVGEVIAALRQDRRDGLGQRLAWALAFGALGLAASSFFWVPALLETAAVQLSAITGPAGYDFRGNFLSLETLLAGPFTYDPHRVLTPMPTAIGRGMLACVALGLFAWISELARRRAAPGTHTRVGRDLLLLALGVACVAMTLQPSQPVWEVLPLAQLIQFPYRWLGPATLFLAPFGARGLVWLQEQFDILPWPKALQQGLPMALLAAIVVLAWPWTFSKDDPTLPAQPAIADLYEAETELHTIGLTSNGEFLPLNAVLPEPDPAWAQAAYAVTAERLDRTTLPESALVTSLSQERLAAAVDMEAPAATLLVFRWFEWPGWQATLDGAPVSVTAATGSGFVAVAVPAGRHHVEVWLGLTPLRWTVSVLSGLALVIALSLTIWLYRRRSVAPGPRPSPPAVSPVPRTALAIGLVLCVSRVGLAFTPSPFSQSRFDGSTVSGLASPLRVVFGGELVLLGLDVEPTVAADSPLVLTAYWALTAAPLDHDISYSFQLWDAYDRPVGHVDVQHPGGWPTRRWFAGDYAVDNLAVAIDPATAPGTYRLMVTAYNADADHATLTGRVNDGPEQAYVPLGHVQVTRPSQGATPTDLPDVTWHPQAEGPFAAVGVSHLPIEAQSGDVVLVDLYWQARASGLDVEPRLVLRDSLGRDYDLGEALWTSDGLGPADWRVDDLFALTTPIVIAPDAAAGPANLVLTGTGPDVTLGSIDIGIPTRFYDVPDDLTSAEFSFAEAADLLGYRLSGDLVPGGALTVDLVWRSREVTSHSLKVFVHVLGADGLPAAQSDSVPVQGLRQTSGWLPEEVIVDTHQIVLPDTLSPGAYTLEVGLYDPATGARVAVRPADTNANGPAQDTVELQTIVLLAR